jgi:phosphatidate cytidylyltransferase
MRLSFVPSLSPSLSPLSLFSPSYSYAWFAFFFFFSSLFQYFGGFFLGKKVCKHYWGPKKGQRIKFFALSPNKTWEGFLTGAVFTLIWGFYFSRYVIVQPSLFNLWDPDIIACAHSDLRRFSHASASAQAQLLEVNAGHRCAYPEYMLDRDYAIPSWGGGVLQQTAAGLASVPYAGPVLGFSPDGLKIRTLPIQWHFILIGLFISLVAPFGGFFASGLKRAYGIKDFDSFLPGHGGLMDRLDCHLITGFMTRIHYMAFVVPFHTTIMKLLVDVAKLPAVQQHDFFNRLVETLGEDGANGGATCAALVG